MGGSDWGSPTSPSIGIRCCQKLWKGFNRLPKHAEAPPPDSSCRAACSRHPATGQSDSLVIGCPLLSLRVTSSHRTSAVFSKVKVDADRHPGLLS
jgi:hypothetical protein